MSTGTANSTIAFVMLGVGIIMAFVTVPFFMNSNSTPARIGAGVLFVIAAILVAAGIVKLRIRP